MTAGAIAERSGGHVVRGDPDAFVTSWAFDSRALAPGACFVALRGERDGHDFVDDALRAGAHVVLVEHPVAVDELPANGAVVVAPDALAALQAVARSARIERADLRVVAVTGSTGKTSTKDLLAAALASVSAYANPESYNNEFGLPITLLNAPASAPVVVAEMGERFPGDVAALCAIARPDVGIVTNVGLAHAEHLGGPEGVAAVLAELLEALPTSGLALLNADDPWTVHLASRTKAEVVTVGLDATADYPITGVELDRSLQPSFTLSGERFSVPLRGAHQVTNAAMAAVVARRAFGLAWPDIRRDLAAASPPRWRMELIEGPDGLVVLNDAYNANPTSMEAALRALARLPAGGRRIAVLGDMRELGVHAADAHAAVGRLAGELRIDVLVGVGVGGGQIVEAARGGVAELHSVPDANAARALLEASVHPGDAVLVKASRALGLQVVAEHLAPRGVAS